MPGGESVLLKHEPPQPRVPVLIAGGGEKVTLRQVAEHADASNFGAGGPMGNAWTLDDVRRKYAAPRQHCRAVGRPYESVLRTRVGGLFLGEGIATREESFTTPLGHRYLVLRGDPAGAVAHYRALAEAGVQYVILLGLDDPASLRLFGERVAPAFA